MTGKPKRQFDSLLLRFFLALVGIGIAAFGYLCLRNGVWVYKTFSERFGKPTIAFAADWIGIGVLLFLLGVLPWDRWLARWNRKR